MSYLRTFHDPPDLALVGGKAGGLHRLVSWGLPVPHGVVLTADAYRSCAASPRVADPVAAARRLLEGSGAVDARSIAAVAGEVREAIMAESLTDEVEAALANAWESMVGVSGPDVSVSVRSSATAEDMVDSSFAGQHATVLGVRGLDALRAAVRECWASLWTPAAVMYRVRRDYPVDGTAMAVVVQSMVRADVSGVAFSVNPITGSAGEVVINAAWGLGEAIVSGLVTPDSYTVDKSSMAVVQRSVSTEKTIMLLAGGPNGTEQRAVPPAQAAAPALTDALALEVARIALEAERRAGDPQDVEWAMEGDRLFLLQTRPITAS